MVSTIGPPASGLGVFVSWVASWLMVVGFGLVEACVVAVCGAHPVIKLKNNKETITHDLKNMVVIVSSCIKGPLVSRLEYWLAWGWR